jgi:hypothetical protein
METRMLPSRSALLLPILFLLASKPAAPQTFAALCNGPGLLCVSSALVRSQLSNPLAFTVIINSTEDIAVTWEVTDSTGLVLESNSADNFLLPLKSVTPQRKTLHIKDYFIKPAKSDIGMLTLTPTRRDSSGGKTDLPPLKIPVFPRPQRNSRFSSPMTAKPSAPKFPGMSIIKIKKTSLPKLRSLLTPSS